MPKYNIIQNHINIQDFLPNLLHHLTKNQTIVELSIIVIKAKLISTIDQLLFIKKMASTYHVAPRLWLMLARYGNSPPSDSGLFSPLMFFLSTSFMKEFCLEYN